MVEDRARRWRRRGTAKPLSVRASASTSTGLVNLRTIARSSRAIVQSEKTPPGLDQLVGERGPLDADADAASARTPAASPSSASSRCAARPPGCRRRRARTAGSAAPAGAGGRSRPGPRRCRAGARERPDRAASTRSRHRPDPIAARHRARVARTLRVDAATAETAESRSGTRPATGRGPPSGRAGRSRRRSSPPSWASALRWPRSWRPVRVGPIGGIGARSQPATRDLFALAGADNPAARSAPSQAGLVVPARGRSSSASTSASATPTCSSGCGAATQMTSIDLDSGLEAWRRSFPPVGDGPPPGGRRPGAAASRPRRASTRPHPASWSAPSTRRPPTSAGRPT